MSDKQNTVNGWTNYQTWATYTWLVNDEQSSNYWREQTESCRTRALQCPEFETGEWSADETAQTLLTEQLKEEFEDASPLTEPTAYADLLEASFEEIDWREIAEAFLVDFRNDESTRPVKAAFRPGRFMVAARASDSLPPDEIATALGKHLAGDWGDVCEEDRQANEESLKDGLRLLSVYHTSDGTKFWIITEADRSATTVLLPEEY